MTRLTDFLALNPLILLLLMTIGIFAIRRILLPLLAAILLALMLLGLIVVISL